MICKCPCVNSYITHEYIVNMEKNINIDIERQSPMSSVSCTSGVLSPMALDYCVPAPVDMGEADMRDYINSPTLSSYSYVDENYGGIKIVSNNEIADDKHQQLTYKYKRSDKYQDIFDMKCLNKYLNEHNDYIIAGSYGSKTAFLFTRHGSLIGSIRRNMCEKCAKKWKHSFTV